ncbi:cytochrome c3 family protein [Sulfuritalea sp.]|uniref:cytochrome c3 family protein n=1 Tax=Sulfuritalea sp. TaxID=2480090 RepID=UPI00286E142D|nr:cytochrome c3 family protein [Sulfuritalea sp.]
MKKSIVGSLLALASVFLIYGCTGGVKTYPNAPFKGVVEDGSKETFLKVANATVWLIPATDVAAMGKTPIEVKKDAKNDEPLEDNLAANRGRYLNTKTNAKGEFSFADVPGGKYFVYVEPATSKYLPGGDKSRKALGTDELGAAPMLIKISGNVPPDAKYIGSSACIECHEEQKDVIKTAHRLGIKVIGKQSKLQDYSRFPDFNKGLDKLMAGTKFYFYSFDKGRSFDKYQIGTKAPADASSVSFTATFYKDSDGKLKFRTENARDPKDQPRVYPVEMTYGGAVYKQRYLFRVGANLFPFVQFNQNGDDSFADRGRKPWRDYHGDWLYNEQTKKLTDPSPAKSFDKECASCHYNAYTLTKNAKGDYIAGSSNDRNGEIDIDGDGKPNEINMGCETCHGPGSVHDKAKEIDMPATIVSPNKLSAERASMICGQCHSRPQGNLKNDQPVNTANKMMLPGTARNVYLKDYTTREDAAAKDYWADGLHSKSHHQQYSDFIKSSKHRNGNQLVACADCHDTHGNGKFAHQLKADPKTPEACTSCHKDSTDLKAHLADKSKCTVDVAKITCSDCHNTKTMQTGAGLGKGLNGKDGKNYWLNDITSHVYDVPRKDNKGVKGVASGTSMPIPYTKPCGAACHDTKNL